MIAHFNNGRKWEFKWSAEWQAWTYNGNKYRYFLFFDNSEHVQIWMARQVVDLDRISYLAVPRREQPHRIEHNDFIVSFK